MEVVYAVEQDLMIFSYTSTYFLFVTDYLSGDSVYLQDAYGGTTYYLNLRQYKYTWQEAQKSCSDRSTRIARSPIPDFIISKFAENVARGIDTDIWIAGVAGNCMTLKRQCKQLQTLFGGQSRCVEYEYIPSVQDCDSGRMLYVICETSKSSEIQHCTASQYNMTCTL